jgi:hypothetical protein
MLAFENAMLYLHILSAFNSISIGIVQRTRRQGLHDPKGH